MNIIISEACDGFELIIVEQGSATSRFWFDQENNKKGLIDFFKKVGIEAEYEESY